MSSAKLPPAAPVRSYVPSREDDPSIDSVLIDRELKHLIELKGIDLIHLEETLLTEGVVIYPNDEPIRAAVAELFVEVFLLRQTVSNTPIFSTDISIGTASFCGNQLDIAGRLPETICASAPGKRLGDLVATGLKALDDRRIVSALRCESEYGHKGTRFVFAPDLVQLSSRASRCEQIRAQRL